MDHPKIPRKCLIRRISSNGRTVASSRGLPDLFTSSKASDYSVHLIKNNYYLIRNIMPGLVKAAIVSNVLSHELPLTLTVGNHNSNHRALLG